MPESVLDWLLDGDPSIRWQVERDLLGAPEGTWLRTRGEVARDGWGSRLLDLQDPSGTWGQGLYNRKWTSTTYTLLLLRRFGLDPDNTQARLGCEQLLDRASWVEGGITYWESHSYPEQCVNAMVLSVCAYFGVFDDRTQSILDMLVAARTEDGAWNCRAPRGDTHGSFHTTMSVLEALAICDERGIGGPLRNVLEGAEEFLLMHRLFRSHTTGDVIDPVWLIPHFPPRWHYDTLRGLDHFVMTGREPDDRCSDAVDELVARRRADGTWAKGPEYGGELLFRLEPGRTPGRWNTLRALRVLRWWNG